MATVNAQRRGDVLHVVASTDRRGAETAAVDLARALNGFGLAGEVVALAPGHVGGLDVPVLLLDGSVVCRHRLDTVELKRLLR